MAHFAKIENDLVIQVLVVPNEQEHRGNEYLNEIGLTGEWIQTSYNAKIRKKFAGKGDIYDRHNDRFIPEKKYESWIWDEEAYGWKAPITKPEDDNDYRWDEESTSWVLVEAE